ncbi:MAG: hypothetical protein FGM41_11510 [Bacteroidetes bacterium]|nr:hypothetical protein [Bacteroidota bacterium]
MKTNYKIILYLLPIVLLFTTCRKNTTKPADQHFYYYLTKEQLNKTPYFTNPAFDTLTYISNQNDTLIFAKIGTDSLWYEVGDYDPSGSGDKFYHYQQLRNRYATLKGEGKFEVVQMKLTSDGVPDQVKIVFGSLFFYATDNRIGTKNGNIFYDSLLIKNMVYNKVTKYYHNRNQSLVGNCFLNESFGLINSNSISDSFSYFLIK